MIFEALAGVFVSSIFIVSFLRLNYVESVNKWILKTSKFIYYSGHPLLDDDQIFVEIKHRFKGVFGSLLLVLFKTVLFLVLAIILVALSSILVAVLNGNGVPSFESGKILNQLFPSYLLKLPFIIGSFIPIFLIPIFRKRKKKETYSAFDKLLHYLFLGNKNIANFSFRLELLFHRNKIKSQNSNRNIYVSGMARAGTTVIMQYLGELNEVDSLSYRNLPFLFLTKTWPKLVSKKTIKEKERFHQDGVKHSIASYEALEEPFFRNNLGVEYIKSNSLVKHKLSDKVFKKYNKFRKLAAGDKIYLAKNNNHLLRAESLHKHDVNNNNSTITIIPFRNPYEQANSLLKQHRLLSGLQLEDEFTLDYMDFLVHHEFGLHCKIPLLDKINVNSISNMDKNKIDYWLEIWYLYYNQVYKIFNGKKDFYFICYESFVNNPQKSIETLLTTLKISNHHINSIEIKEFKLDQKKTTPFINMEYMNVYNDLKLIAINNLE